MEAPALSLECPEIKPCKKNSAKGPNFMFFSFSSYVPPWVFVFCLFIYFLSIFICGLQRFLFQKHSKYLCFLNFCKYLPVFFMSLEQMGKDSACAQFQLTVLNQKPCPWPLSQLCFQSNNQPGEFLKRERGWVRKRLRIS